MMILREYNKSDCGLIVEYLNNPSVTHFLSTAIPQPYTTVHAEDWVKAVAGNPLIRAIEYDGVYVGDIGVFRGDFEQSRTAKIGYWVAEEYWNKGIASAALIAHTTEIFKSTDINRLHTQVFEENVASIRVLEKAGFRREAHQVNGAFKDNKAINTYLYALLP